MMLISVWLSLSLISDMYSDSSLDSLLDKSEFYASMDVQNQVQ